MKITVNKIIFSRFRKENGIFNFNIKIISEINKLQMAQFKSWIRGNCCGAFAIIFLHKNQSFEILK